MADLGDNELELAIAHLVTDPGRSAARALRGLAAAAAAGAERAAASAAAR